MTQSTMPFSVPAPLAPAADGPVTLSIEPAGPFGSHLARLTINRPAKRNALNRAAMDAFALATATLAADPDLAVVIVRGAGDKAFQSGGDLDELKAVTTLELAEKLSDVMGGALATLAGLDALVIAAINGHAIGGGSEIALACDLRFITDTARIIFRHVDLGVVPAWGTWTRLEKAVGTARALSLLTLERDLSAERCVELGLCLKAFPQGDFDGAIEEIAHSLLSLPPLALKGVKRVSKGADPRAVFTETWVSPGHWDALARFFAK
jgi:enoyl-CoA hydratase